MLPYLLYSAAITLAITILTLAIANNFFKKWYAAEAAAVKAKSPIVATLDDVINRANSLLKGSNAQRVEVTSGGHTVAVTAPAAPAVPAPAPVPAPKPIVVAPMDPTPGAALAALASDWWKAYHEADFAALIVDLNPFRTGGITTAIFGLNRGAVSELPDADPRKIAQPWGGDMSKCWDVRAVNGRITVFLPGGLGLTNLDDAPRS